jgi:hypothetical protein
MGYGYECISTVESEHPDQDQEGVSKVPLGGVDYGEYLQVRFINSPYMSGYKVAGLHDQIKKVRASLILCRDFGGISNFSARI